MNHIEQEGCPGWAMNLQTAAVSLKVLLLPLSLSGFFFFNYCAVFWPFIYSRRSGCFAQRVVLQSWE